MVGKPMRKWWWWLMKKQLSLSIRNTLGDSNHYSNTTNATGIKMGQVAEAYGGYADDMVEGLGKLAKFQKFYGVK